MRVVRASEIGTYLFCRRAFWYHLQGNEPENKAELAGGTELHQQHGRMVLASSCLQAAGYIALLAAVLVLTIWLLQTIL